MSIHPNVILMAVLTPDDLARKTMREIMKANNLKDMEMDDIKLAEGEEYSSLIMEEDYEENIQIAAPVGSLVFYDLVTYGYGESINWNKLEAHKARLDVWAKNMSDEFHCSYEIRVGANYW